MDAWMDGYSQGPHSVWPVGGTELIFWSPELQKLTAPPLVTGCSCSRATMSRSLILAESSELSGLNSQDS